MNPKQRLTSLSEVLKVKAIGPQAARFRFSEGARRFADAGLGEKELGGTQISKLQDFSITTVEEVAALAHLENKNQTALLDKLGISKSAGRKLLRAMKSTEAGAEEMRDWDRLSQYDYGLGLELDFDNPPAADVAALGGAAGPGPGPLAAPAAVSLLGAHMPAVRDQLDRGTCVAFTAVACLEYHQARFRGRNPLDLSEQFVYWDMVKRTNRRNLVAAFPNLARTGACREVTWPYNPKEIPDNDAQDPPPPTAITEAPAYCCSEVTQIAPRDVSAIKSSLGEERVVAIGVPVYQSWINSPVVRKYGNITLPLPGEVPDPVGHAVALVGYEENSDFAGGGYFIVRNSWGLRWAAQSVIGPGYGTIPYRYIERYNWDAWCIRA